MTYGTRCVAKRVKTLMNTSNIARDTWNVYEAVAGTPLAFSGRHYLSSCQAGSRPELIKLGVACEVKTWPLCGSCASAFGILGLPRLLLI
jgi:hypothetical protein